MNWGNANRPAPLNARRGERYEIATEAQIREPGGVFRFNVDVVDLSLTGFGFESSSNLSVGQRVYLTIPSFAGLEAKVAWRSGRRYGCQFTSGLHPAVRDHIVSHYPAKAGQR